MRVGDTIHLDGLRAEYSHYGRDRFTPCTLPNGEYVVVGFDDAYVKLAWKKCYRCCFNKTSLSCSEDNRRLISS